MPARKPRAASATRWSIPMAEHSSCRCTQPIPRTATAPGHSCELRVRAGRSVQVVFADGGYQGPRVANASRVRVEIVREPKDQVRLAVLPRRWVVERFFAWINRNRRLAKDVESTMKSATAFLYAASAILLLRRLAR